MLLEYFCRVKDIFFNLLSCFQQGLYKLKFFKLDFSVKSIFLQRQSIRSLKTRYTIMSIHVYVSRVQVDALLKIYTPSRMSMHDGSRQRIDYTAMSGHKGSDLVLAAYRCDLTSMRCAQRAASNGK